MAGYDLSLFFLTSTTPQFRRDYLTALLRRYHTTLRDVLAGQDVDIDDKFSFEDLVDDYRYGLNNGITFGLYAIHHICHEKDEGESESIKKEVIKEDSNVRERLRGVLEDMAESGII